MTQTEANKIIDELLAASEEMEVRRDDAIFESRQYWAYHDAAIELRRHAEKLMPVSSRSVE